MVNTYVRTIFTTYLLPKPLTLQVVSRQVVKNKQLNQHGQQMLGINWNPTENFFPKHLPSILHGAQVCAGSLPPSNPHPTMNAIHHHNSSATMFHGGDQLENTYIHIMGNGSRKLSCRVGALVVSSQLSFFTHCSNHLPVQLVVQKANKQTNKHSQSLNLGCSLDRGLDSENKPRGENKMSNGWGE